MAGLEPGTPLSIREAAGTTGSAAATMSAPIEQRDCRFLARDRRAEIGGKMWFLEEQQKANFW
ncbi:MAG: hypothetical protein VX764_05405 [Planctomycetota bacterium]|nr:hypothetical protein [Planctomycetota bacterium]